MLRLIYGPHVHQQGRDEGQAAPLLRVCPQAQKRGWDTCPTKSVPAGEIERFVLEQIDGVGRDPAVLEATARRVRQQHDKAVADLAAEQKAVERELARHGVALRKLAATGDPDPARLADLEEQARKAERRLTEVREPLVKVRGAAVDAGEVSAALSSGLDPTRVERDRHRAGLAVVPHPVHQQLDDPRLLLGRQLLPHRPERAREHGHEAAA